MNLEISTSATDYRANAPATNIIPSSLPQPSILLKKENEPWRGSSGFGLANILNRSTTATAPPLPTFSLPSLHSFGKPLITKSDPSINRARSILNESSASPQASTAPVPVAPAVTSETQAINETSPLNGPVLATKDTPRKPVPSRRIAPAPTDEDENEQEEGGSDSIRGGRWSSDEHERFLAGFRIHGHKWKRVQQVVRTRSVTQVRTHAQKYLLKLAKLKADKKAGNGESQNSSSDTETSQATTQDDSDDRSPRKKMRRHEPTDSLDEEYISAAATTLCFLMRQKIDCLFDSRHEDDNKDLEPYDCYTTEPASEAHEQHDIETSRKRPYMHFITESTGNYSYDEQHHPTPEATSYSIDGQQLCS